MRRFIILTALVALFIDAFPQSWESVRNCDEYIYGEGRGATLDEAKKQALDDLVSKIAINVTSQTNNDVVLTNNNGTVNETSQFRQTVSTYTQATLTNTQEKILQERPDAHVVRWIKKSEIKKIFELRELKAKDMVEAALRAEEKGNIDDALRNYYWALTLLKSLQYPNEVMYKGHVLTNWIKEQMDDVFRNISVNYEGDEKLWITYKGKPVSSLGYQYFDGLGWSNVYRAKDGQGVLELPPNHAKNIQLKYECAFFGEARIDPELESVLNLVKETAMPRAQINVPLDAKVTKKMKKEKAQAAMMSFSSTNTALLAQPETMDKDEANDYMNVTAKVITAIQKKDYQAAENCFTPEGWDMYNKLIKYGSAKIIDTSNLRFYEHQDIVEERGLKMSFSFKSGVVKTFVEDVVLSFNKEKKITNIAFGLGRTAEDDILNRSIYDEKSRFILMNLLENYKTAYALKRLDYIASIFDDDAIIITGTVLKKAPKSVNIENRAQISSEGNQIIKKNRQTKTQYLENLKRCFARNEYVNIHFSNNDVTKLGNKWGEAYAIQIAQDYCSSTYGDQGFLLLYVDINKPDKPLIKLRTWQPEKDPKFGLYGPGDF